jgi:hypothetical protein
MKKVAAYTLVAIATAIAIYGVIHERLLDQPIWNPTGLGRFAIYAAAFGPSRCCSSSCVPRGSRRALGCSSPDTRLGDAAFSHRW